MCQGNDAQLARAAQLADAALVIAPETGGVLHRLCRMVEDVGGVLLGPSSAAVQLTADKWRLAEHLAVNGVRTPPCRSAGVNDWSYPQVCKPRDGAGSQATFLVECADNWINCIDQARREDFEGEPLAQPYVPGVPASASFLIGPDKTLPLPPTRQVLSNDGRFHYLGSVADLPALQARRAAACGLQAVRAIEGLRGYVGVDLVLGQAADGNQDYVIEINPRLTSSYLELRRIMRENLMGLMLKLLKVSHDNARTTCLCPSAAE